MNMHTALRLSAVILTISLMALVSDIAIYLLHIAVAPKVKQALDVVGFIWPLALVFFGTYLRKVQAARKQSPSA
jgi:hypothetical protein